MNPYLLWPLGVLLALAMIATIFTLKFGMAGPNIRTRFNEGLTAQVIYRSMAGDLFDTEQQFADLRELEVGMPDEVDTLEEVLEQVRRLPEEEQQRLVADLQADQSASPSEGHRQKAMKRWHARAGTGHADVAIFPAARTST